MADPPSGPRAAGTDRVEEPEQVGHPGPHVDGCASAGLGNSGEGSKGGGDKGRGGWLKWLPHDPPPFLLPCVGAAAAVGVTVAVASRVHKHVLRGDSTTVKKDIVTGETLVTDPSMAVTVQSGDTLYSIAQTCKVTVPELRAANNIKGDLILPGSKLYIPAVVPQEESDGADIK